MHSPEHNRSPNLKDLLRDLVWRVLLHSQNVLKWWDIATLSNPLQSIKETTYAMKDCSVIDNRFFEIALSTTATRLPGRETWFHLFGVVNKQWFHRNQKDVGLAVINKVHIQVWIPLQLAPYIVIHNHPYISSCSRYPGLSLQLPMYAGMASDFFFMAFTPNMNH